MGASEFAEGLIVPQRRHGGGKGAKLRRKVNAVSFSEATARSPLSVAPSSKKMIDYRAIWDLRLVSAQRPFMEPEVVKENKPVMAYPMLNIRK